MESNCRAWFCGDPILEAYHDKEWCKVHHEDQFLFEMLCLEGASVGLSWKTIMHKRDNYRKAFHDFDIEACAKMTDAELEGLQVEDGIIKNRSKIFSVRSNAQAVMRLQEEFGSFDAYLWSFTKGQVMDRHWERIEQIPAVSDLSRQMAKDLKKRGMSYVGPVITYSFMQAIGMVNDHLADCKHR